MDRQLDELCNEYAKLKAVLPAMEQAQAEAERRVHSSYFKQTFQKQLAVGCAECVCCRYRDGSGPERNCVVKITTAP